MTFGRVAEALPRAIRLVCWLTLAVLLFLCICSHTWLICLSKHGIQQSVVHCMLQTCSTYLSSRSDSTITNPIAANPQADTARGSQANQPGLSAKLRICACTALPIWRVRSGSWTAVWVMSTGCCLSELLCVTWQGDAPCISRVQLWCSESPV
jgi:hypothetical protein